MAARRLQPGPLRVTLARSLFTDLPSVVFGVGVTVTSNEDDSDLEVRVMLTVSDLLC